MFRVAREIDFCYGHRLLNYDGKCRYLHGHNGKAVIAMERPALDDRGMVIDFTDIKRLVADWIDRQLDHRMLLSKDDPLLPMLQSAGEPVFVMDENPTAENIARLIYRYAASQAIPVVEVTLWETPRCYATYSE